MGDGATSVGNRVVTFRRACIGRCFGRCHLGDRCYLSRGSRVVTIGVVTCHRASIGAVTCRFSIGVAIVTCRRASIGAVCRRASIGAVTCLSVTTQRGSSCGASIVTIRRPIGRRFGSRTVIRHYTCSCPDRYILDMDIHR